MIRDRGSSVNSELCRRKGGTRADRALAGWVEATGRRGSCGRCGRSLDDRRSLGGDRVPLGAELEDALARCLTRLLVERVAVERVLAIGDLEAAVTSPRRAKQRRFYPRPRRRFTALEQGPPERRTAPATRALPVPVLLEE